MGRSIDREKVIKGLECCMVTDDDASCTDCPYNDPTTFKYGENGCLRKELMPDAIKLLKEQEAVRPIKKDTVEITARYEFDCPCGAPLLIGQPYCAGCGKKVKWE